MHSLLCAHASEKRMHRLVSRSKRLFKVPSPAPYKWSISFRLLKRPREVLDGVFGGETSRGVARREKRLVCTRPLQHLTTGTLLALTDHIMLVSAMAYVAFSWPHAYAYAYEGRRARGEECPVNVGAVSSFRAGYHTECQQRMARGRLPYTWPVSCRCVDTTGIVSAVFDMNARYLARLVSGGGLVHV